MQPIIRRTITITVTETWTITWHDGHETVWHETREVAVPAVHEPGTPLPLLTNDDDLDDGVHDPDAADQTADDG